MAEAGNGCNRGGSDKVRPRSEVEASGPQINDQPIEGASASISVRDSSVGGGNGSHAIEVGDEADRCTEEVERTPVTMGPEGSQI